MKQKFVLVTQYLGTHIELKKVQEGVKKYRFLNRDHPLVIELLPNQYAVLTKFGTVGFWNVKKRLANQFISEIIPYVRNYRPNFPYSDTLRIYVGFKKEESMSFEQVYINELDVEKIKIISYISAQSVALEHYEEEIDFLLKDVWTVIDNLRRTGKMLFSEKVLLKRIGEILAAKQDTIVNIALFDKPDETWDRPELEKLYNHLYSEYELQDRFDVLNKKLDFLSESNSTLINFLSTQRNNFLELVIVVLIVVEIGIYILEWLKIFP